ncbi:TPA: type IV secretion system protein VirB10 [Neisseria meningitidis]|jgi:type IV secretion system protein VirB10
MEKSNKDPKDFTNPDESGLGFNPQEQMPQVANQGRSNNSTKKGLATLFFFGAVLFMGFLGYRSLVSNSTEKAEEEANAIKRAPTTVPAFTKTEEEAPAPPPDAMASMASMPAVAAASEPMPMPMPMPAENPPVMVDEGERKPTPHEIRLRSPLMVGSNASNLGSSGNGSPMNIPNQESSEDTGLLGASRSSNNGNQTALSNNFTATATPSTSAGLLKNRDMLLAKGTIVTCNMATKLETQIAGQTACVIPNNIYSENGNVVLLDRGTVVEGEYQKVAEVGRTRIFVLWTRARTPNGVVINLDSAASDKLGGAGMDGYVNNHWFKRFGNAIMFSLIQDGVSTGFNRLEKSQTAQTVIYENSQDATNKIVEEIIKSTANLPPTIYRNQGDKVGIYISRDLDFSSVYQLKSRAYH